MNWIILLLAGLFEVSLTFCLGKTRAASGVEFYLWGSGFLASTVLSMALLAKAVQTLPLGTAYAIWTGIGAVGTVLIGIFVFKEPATPIRLFFPLPGFPLPTATTTSLCWAAWQRILG